VIEQVLRDQRAWPGVISDRFTPSLAATTHRKRASSHRDAVSLIRDDLEAFSERSNASQIILVNVASTERGSDLEIPTRDELEAAIDASDPRLSPTLLYAYAAITAGVAVANFTPSSCVEQPGMLETAVSCSVPVAGRDGKTGQTFLKTALAPALRSRNLRVNGWYSANLLGNGDGRALRDPEALARKLLTKRSVLDSLMGYPVENHIVTIDFYPPRGDDKEAWDVIDFTGFLGRTMQLRLNLQCSDSLLAAPLVIELGRLLALAHHRNRVGSVSELGYFFKDPMPTATGIVEHDLFRQQATLLEWLKG
jgi:myo-inositol-1-phosphate synthase